MKIYLIISIIFTAVLFSSCDSGQTQNKKSSLQATEFSEKIKEQPDAQVIDVRTSAEFTKGHLQNAKNIDWNSSGFAKQISSLDRNKPVFVYCLSGSRSTSAVNKMISEGFTEVYELKGGVIKWRNANLPLTTLTAGATSGMTRKQFDEILNSDKSVLVDFYADWCEPCRKIKPYLDEISKEMPEKVLVLRINVDENPELSSDMKVDAIPDLRIYKNKELKWTNNGYIGKEELKKNILSN